MTSKGVLKNGFARLDGQGMDYDWLIIGGGIHGVHIAARLLGEAGVDRERLAIVDPNDGLLAVWRRCTTVTGMKHLRSPAVHNVDIAHSSLFDFVGRRRRKSKTFIAPYNRPSLKSFNAHCDRVSKTYALSERHVRGLATDCSVRPEGVEVSLASGDVLSSRHLVLALGASHHLAYPDWALGHPDRIHHVFDPEFTEWPSSAERIAVVGGGISAAQVALRLVEDGHEVTVVTRHPWRHHQFDSDPGWLGPKLMKAFSREPRPERRRGMIDEARHRGSIPPDVERALRAASEGDRLVVTQAEVEAVERDGTSSTLQLGETTPLVVDRVFVATGFSPSRPGGALVDRLVDTAGLACAPCGYPVVDTALRWHEHIQVSGPLAELELGPVARNIAGARRAGDRIVKSLTAG
jgi:pyruvate/2-oxoglutarate dehydrogenase complex dihydrolipoamide dehydrogenase (E3) component